VLAYDYPLMGFFWSMLIFFLWFMWIWLLFKIFADIFRSSDLSGFAKAVWIIFVIVLPFIGVFVYIVARGNSMTQRSVAIAQEQQMAFDSYVRETAGTTSAADELAKLAKLKEQGILTDAEFAAKKQQLLA
jgi:signal transduction histidine kinase